MEVTVFDSENNDERHFEIEDPVAMVAFFGYLITLRINFIYNNRLGNVNFLYQKIYDGVVGVLNGERLFKVMPTYMTEEKVQKLQKFLLWEK